MAPPPSRGLTWAMGELPGGSKEVVKEDVVEELITCPSEHDHRIHPLHHRAVAPPGGGEDAGRLHESPSHRLHVEIVHVVEVGGAVLPSEDEHAVVAVQRAGRVEGAGGRGGAMLRRQRPPSRPAVEEEEVVEEACSCSTEEDRHLFLRRLCHGVAVPWRGTDVAALEEDAPTHLQHVELVAVVEVALLPCPPEHNDLHLVRQQGCVVGASRWLRAEAIDLLPAQVHQVQFHHGVAVLAASPR
mmetsp:Transcript_23867/g.77688  ORF Transcript_23867/g.77688 Transcript_23867/m.77688 type:complete len:243 (-) Transcript_23867:807-1535(-)